MREDISSTIGVDSSTIPAMLKSSSRRLFSRHALRVQQHVPIISEKLRNFRLPDGCFFSLFFPLRFSGCSISHSGNTLPVLFVRTRPAALTSKCRAKHARKCRITFYYFVGIAATKVLTDLFPCCRQRRSKLG